VLLEVGNLLWLIAFGEGEVLRLEPMDGLAVAVLHDDIDDDNLGAGLQDGGAGTRLRRRGLGCLGERERRQKH
jgi:hypothetical protein